MTPIGLADALRLDSQADDHKEWHHFLVHQGERTALLNFQLGGRQGRLIALSWLGGWQGDVRTFPPSQIGARPGRVDLRLGPHRVRWDGRCYHVDAALPELGWSARLRLEPRSAPLPSWGLSLAPGRPMGWVQVPRLRADGEVQAGGVTWRFADAFAYHDHNWGRFWWSDDFVWEWGTLGGPGPDDPWALGFVRRLDRSRHTVLSTAFYLFRHGQPHRVVRGEGVTLHMHGRWRDHVPSLPRAGALLLPGDARDLPERLVLQVRSGDLTLDAELEARALARLVMPWEGDASGVTTLHQVRLHGSVRGRVGTEDLGFEAPGILELVRQEGWPDRPLGPAGLPRPVDGSPGPLGRLALRVLTALHAEQPARYLRFAACLPGIEAQVGRERLRLQLCADGPRLVTELAAPALRLSPRTLRALLDDQLGVTDAVRAGLLDLRGPVADLPQVEEAVARLVAACLTAPQAAGWRADLDHALEQT